MDYDITIIGAGCVGSAIAQRLAKYDVKILLLEKEADVAMGTTKANSGIIHQGYFTTHGSLKEALSLRGNDLFDEICPKIHVQYDRIGALFCATNEKEKLILQGEYEKSQKRGVQVEFIENYDRLREFEPHLNEGVNAGLHFPRAGIITPWELTIGLAEHALLNETTLFLNFEVAFIQQQEDGFLIRSMDGRQVGTRYIINAAGLFADRIARMVGDTSFTIIPRRGEYIMFDKGTLPLKKILFPCPTVVSKGIVVGPTLHDNFYVGPNAHEVDSKEAIGTTSMGLNEILTGGAKIVDSLPLRKHITNFAGIRASTQSHDFIVKKSDQHPQFLLAAGIDSPGLSSCLAIAEKLEEILRTECNLPLNLKSNYIPELEAQVRLDQLSDVELAKKIKENPQWGNMICRCEHVTEAEIVTACHRPIPCTNSDMIKRRLRPGMGRCQGGFCLPKVMKIISREQEMIFEQVSKTGGSSDIVFKRSKNICSEIHQGEIL